MPNAGDSLRTLEAVARGREDHWQRERDAWLRDLQELRTRVLAWLDPVQRAHRARCVNRDFTLDEPGEYRAPGLEIDLVASTHRRILLRPQGVRVSGAQGRVDLEHGVKREILLRFTDSGKTRWLSFAGGRERELDEDVFFDLLARVADIDLDRVGGA